MLERTSLIFSCFFWGEFIKKLDHYNVMDKKNFHELARFVPKGKVDPEVKAILAAIVAVAKAATPMID
jgi:hypothetical protein